MTPLMARSRSSHLRFLKGLQLEFCRRCPESWRAFQVIILVNLLWIDKGHCWVPWREEAVRYDMRHLCSSIIPDIFICLFGCSQAARFPSEPFPPSLRLPRLLTTSMIPAMIPAAWTVFRLVFECFLTVNRRCRRSYLDILHQKYIDGLNLFISLGLKWKKKNPKQIDKMSIIGKVSTLFHLVIPGNKKVPKVGVVALDHLKHLCGILMLILLQRWFLRKSCCFAMMSGYGTVILLAQPNTDIIQ